MKNLIKILYLLILSIFSTSTAVAGGSVANDDLINAITITSVPYTNSVTAIDSDSTGSEVGELSCDSGFYSGTWWYSFTTTVAGTITADALTQNATTINNFSAVNIAIYSGSTHPLTELDCGSSFSDTTLNPAASTMVGPGTYFIAVGNSTANPTADSIITNINFTPAAILATPVSVPVNSTFMLILFIVSLLFLAFLNYRKINQV